jgi:hypothetical protein
VAKPWIHAVSSARKFGGEPEDYIEIHNFMDSSKGTVADNRHRFLSHNSWFIAPDGPLERIFGVCICNSEQRTVSVRAIGEQHILEDFGGVIPTPQDYAMEMICTPWMSGMGVPPSARGTSHDQESKDGD